MVSAALSSAVLWDRFRAQAAKGVEYSYDVLGDGFGIMVGGSVELVDIVRGLASELPFAGDWSWAIAQFVSVVRPDTYLFRADLEHERVVGLTLYARFPWEPGADEFARAVQAARPFAWSGPDVTAFGAALECPGPRGIGFRVDAAGRRGLAVYYKGEADRTQFTEATLRKIAALCDFEKETADAMLADLRPLYTRGQVGVVGLDARSDETPNVVKFDPANVPLSRTLTFMHAKGSAPARVAEILAVAHALRANFVSYLGVKFGPRGFAGCRTYFSVDPDALGSAWDVSVRHPQDAAPTLRLPHY